MDTKQIKNEIRLCERKELELGGKILEISEKLFEATAIYWRNLENNEQRTSISEYFPLGREKDRLKTEWNKIRSRRILLEATQVITNKLQQTQVSFQDLYQAGGIDFLDLFEINNCQCEHPGMSLQDYTNHIQKCLKTRNEIENFKNEMLNIIERAAQNKLTHLIPQTNSNPVITQSNSNSYPTPPPSPNFIAVSSSGSLTSENNISIQSIQPVQENSSHSENHSTNDISKSPSLNSSQNPNFSVKSGLPTENTTRFQPANSEKSENNNLNLLSIPNSNNNSNSEQSQPKSSEKENLNYFDNFTKDKNDNKSNASLVVNNENLTTQKQQIIQQIQIELNKLPNPNLNESKYSNWKQTIENLSSSQQILNYQNNLIQYLQTQKNSLTSQFSNRIESSNSSSQNWGHTAKKPTLIVGIGILVSGIILIGLWKWKMRKVKKNRHE